MDYDALSSLVFYVFAVMAAVCAIGVVAFRNPVTSAMCMALSFLATAGILFGMGAQFLGIVQLVVYAGAILVLFLFVIMMLDVKEEERRLSSLPRAIVGVVIASVFAGFVSRVAIELPNATSGPCPFMSLFCSDYQPSCEQQKGVAIDGGALPKIDLEAAAYAMNPNVSEEEAKANTHVHDASLLGMILYSRFNIAFALLGFALLGGTVGAIALGRKIRKD